MPMWESNVLVVRSLLISRGAVSIASLGRTAPPMHLLFPLLGDRASFIQLPAFFRDVETAAARSVECNAVASGEGCRRSLLGCGYLW